MDRRVPISRRDLQSCRSNEYDHKQDILVPKLNHELVFEHLTFSTAFVRSNFSFIKGLMTEKFWCCQVAYMDQVRMYCTYSISCVSVNNTHISPAVLRLGTEPGQKCLCRHNTQSHGVKWLRGKSRRIRVLSISDGRNISLLTGNRVFNYDWIQSTEKSTVLSTNLSLVMYQVSDSFSRNRKQCSQLIPSSLFAMSL